MRVGLRRFGFLGFPKRLLSESFTCTSIIFFFFEYFTRFAILKVDSHLMCNKITCRDYKQKTRVFLVSFLSNFITIFPFSHSFFFISKMPREIPMSCVYVKTSNLSRFYSLGKRFHFVLTRESLFPIRVKDVLQVCLRIK